MAQALPVLVKGFQTLVKSCDEAEISLGGLALCNQRAHAQRNWKCRGLCREQRGTTCSAKCPLLNL